MTPATLRPQIYWNAERVYTRDTLVSQLSKR
jgi:hypothetical protein